MFCNVLPSQNLSQYRTYYAFKRLQSSMFNGNRYFRLDILEWLLILKQRHTCRLAPNKQQQNLLLQSIKRGENRRYQRKAVLSINFISFTIESFDWINNLIFVILCGIVIDLDSSNDQETDWNRAKIIISNKIYGFHANVENVLIFHSRWRFDSIV